MRWGGGTEPENCIASSVISLPSGSHSVSLASSHWPGSSLPVVSFLLRLCLATFAASLPLPLPLTLHHFVTSLYSLIWSPPLSRRLSPLALLSISVSALPPSFPPSLFPPCVLTWLSSAFLRYLQDLKNAKCHLTRKQTHQTLEK